MEPNLAVVAHRQGGVFRRRQAIAAEYSAVDIKRLLRQGTWTQVRHGIYTAERYDRKQARSDRSMHRLAAAARVLSLRGDFVVSHESAAVHHEIQLLDAWPKEPTLTLCRGDERLSGRGYAVAPVPVLHRVGWVTTPARAVVDCARTLAPEAGFVTMESALWEGLGRSAIATVLDDCRGWPGIARARELFAFAGEDSESPLESLARLWCRDNGVPAPQQQRCVRTVQGLFIGEVDFVWDEYRTVLEMDGRKKYEADERTRGGAALPKPERGVVWREKLREDQLRDSGLQVVRGYWSDGDDGGAQLAGRLRRAFARGQRATSDREYTLGPPVRARFRSLAADSPLARQRAVG
jgi:hypothetical protein